ncbi:hypothetical protein [Acinetobacter rongchengensis]|uniref:Uncharacterized protein n=1 Tax=Acinetobacter rongchengensis TaxID=2419601 RepID=A0A3A8F3K1_9GAMM|nr:hypothetical protein [Acinetobacter rongchengensis]RKG37640.1 hypothetical protein D7V20_10275 [Acinetobacter rongchengensis]
MLVFGAILTLAVFFVFFIGKEKITEIRNILEKVEQDIVLLNTVLNEIRLKHLKKLGLKYLFSIAYGLNHHQPMSLSTLQEVALEEGFPILKVFKSAHEYRNDIDVQDITYQLKMRRKVQEDLQFNANYSKAPFLFLGIWWLITISMVVSTQNSLHFTAFWFWVIALYFTISSTLTYYKDIDQFTKKLKRHCSVE